MRKQLNKFLSLNPDETTLSTPSVKLMARHRTRVSLRMRPVYHMIVRL